MSEFAHDDLYKRYIENSELVNTGEIFYGK